MFVKLLRNFGFCFVSTRWLNSRLTVKKDDDDGDDYCTFIFGVSRTIRANY